jgi:hypothetical protein
MGGRREAVAEVVIVDKPSSLPVNGLKSAATRSQPLNEQHGILTDLKLRIATCRCTSEQTHVNKLVERSLVGLELAAMGPHDTASPEGGDELKEAVGSAELWQSVIQISRRRAA